MWFLFLKKSKNTKKFTKVNKSCYGIRESSEFFKKNPLSQLASIKFTHLEEIKCNQKLIPHLYSNTIQLTSLDNLIKVSYNPYCIYIHNIPLRWSVGTFLPSTDGSRRDQPQYTGNFFFGIWFEKHGHNCHSNEKKVHLYKNAISRHNVLLIKTNI